MTDRANALVVVLEHDTRIDDLEATAKAIGRIKGVISVAPNISNLDAYVAQQRSDLNWTRRIMALLREADGPSADRGEK